jgi:hypothetical protein
MQGYDSRETGKPSKQQNNKESGLQMKSRDIEEALKWWIVLCIGALLGMGLMSWLEYIK